MPTPSDNDPNAGPATPAPERFDELLTKLRSIVERLESGNLTLEDSLRHFEDGMALCRRGAEILDGAEKRVETLLAGPGPARVAPFDAGRDRQDNDRQDND
jgi:exodeoxyribonuclease VII small subunit